MNNLFQNLPAGNDEVIHVLLQMDAVKIERIVSNGQPSPPDFWYDQEQDEWVMLARGTATLEFKNGEKSEMNAGDYLLIPTHFKHRVCRYGWRCIADDFARASRSRTMETFNLVTMNLGGRINAFVIHGLSTCMLSQGVPSRVTPHITLKHPGLFSLYESIIDCRNALHRLLSDRVCGACCC